MAKKPLPSPDVLRQLLRYEPETGHLYWRERSADMFENAWRAPAWNQRYAGTRALNAFDGRGYYKGRLQGEGYLAHRVIWALVHLEWPSEQIDHINGDRADNRLENLRAVSNAENCKNRAISTVNKSGVVGVFFDAKSRSWRAVIRSDGRQHSLGSFPCITAAIIARKKAEPIFGYHENHGRRA